MIKNIKKNMYIPINIMLFVCWYEKKCLILHPNLKHLTSNCCETNCSAQQKGRVENEKDSKQFH